jgi:hypothetical protein
MNDSATTENGGNFDPQQAAALLNQATARARGTFQVGSPLLSLVKAAAFLAAFGGVWLSVRGQHPYTGPTGWALAVLYIAVAIMIGSTAAAVRRATAGVSGPSRRARNAGIAVALVAWVAAIVLMAALDHAGASHPIVFGTYLATVPVLLVCLVAAANGATREDWTLTGTCLAIVIVAAVAAFGGPVGAWLIMGIGVCAVFLAVAAVTTWLQHRSVVRA